MSTNRNEAPRRDPRDTEARSDVERAEPGIDVVVVSYNQRERLLACCASVVASETLSRLIVVDNASSDASVEAIRQACPQAEVLEMNLNLGFAAAMNRGVAVGDSRLILLLNNDARLTDEALLRLAAAMDNDRLGAAGPRLVGGAGQVELSIGRTISVFNETGFRFIELLYRDGTGPLAGIVERYLDKSRETRSLSGACLMLRREAFEEVGGFDERFFLYAEDVDLCRRLRQYGWALRYVASAVVEHDRGVSGAANPVETAIAYRRSQLAFYRKHRGRLVEFAVRLYLAARYAAAILFSRGDRRRLASTMLTWTLRGRGEGG